MYEKIEFCPVCGKDKFIINKICKDFTVSDESFAINECLNCSFKFTSPRPDQVHLPKYYESEDYVSHEDKANNLINLAYKIVRKITIRNKIKVIQKHQSTGTLLDVGCGTGHFLKYCKKKGWKITGTEPDARAKKQAIERTGAKVYQNISALKEQKFDVITLWHVLEHIPDLNENIKLLRKLLNASGVLLIAVPNYKSFDAELYKEYWAGYDVPRHLYHFDRKTIKSLFGKLKFKLIDTVPMKFDAFYVSLLSEKYLNIESGWTSPFKQSFNGFRNGYLSNKKAKKTNQYSSLIYLFKK